MKAPKYKTEKWLELEEKFSNLDSGGKIDKGIFATVVALNCLGVETIGSCAGHETIVYEKEELTDLKSYPYIEITLDTVSRLCELLEIFYVDEFLANNTKLGVLIIPGRYAVLKNVFAPLYHGKHHDVQILTDYQDEFKQFTTWLKRYIAKNANK